jgi:hypothetical protein
MRNTSTPVTDLHFPLLAIVRESELKVRDVENSTLRLKEGRHSGVVRGSRVCRASYLHAITVPG